LKRHDGNLSAVHYGQWEEGCLFPALAPVAV
jgi:hypothetical protein